jgi:hypothetical protein
MEEAQPTAVSRLNHTAVKHKVLRITYPPFKKILTPGVFERTRQLTESGLGGAPGGGAILRAAPEVRPP